MTLLKYAVGSCAFTLFFVGSVNADVCTLPGQPAYCDSMIFDGDTVEDVNHALGRDRDGDGSATVCLCGASITVSSESINANTGVAKLIAVDRPAAHSAIEVIGEDIAGITVFEGSNLSVAGIDFSIRAAGSRAVNVLGGASLDGFAESYALLYAPMTGVIYSFPGSVIGSIKSVQVKAYQSAAGSTETFDFEQTTVGTMSDVHMSFSGQTPRVGLYTHDGTTIESISDMSTANGTLAIYSSTIGKLHDVSVSRPYNAGAAIQYSVIGSISGLKIFAPAGLSIGQSAISTMEGSNIQGGLSLAAASITDFSANTVQNDGSMALRLSSSSRITTARNNLFESRSSINPNVIRLISSRIELLQGGVVDNLSGANHLAVGTAEQIGSIQGVIFR